MEREAARAPSLQCSPWRVSVVTAVSFPPVQAEGPRTHSPSRDRPPVERVDQWRGGIAAAEARPSARVGGLVPARASLLGGAPEPRGQPGHPKRTVFAAILAFASMRTRDSRSLARASLCASPPSPLLPRSWSTREATDLGGHGFRRNRGRDARARRFERKRTRGGEVLTCSATRCCALSYLSLGIIFVSVDISYMVLFRREIRPKEGTHTRRNIVVTNYCAMGRGGRFRDGTVSMTDYPRFVEKLPFGQPFDRKLLCDKKLWCRLYTCIYVYYIYIYTTRDDK